MTTADNAEIFPPAGEIALAGNPRVEEIQSKAVITGDVTQIDLARGQKSGLIEARRVLADVRGIAFTDFTSADVVRNPLVQKIVNAYETHTRSQRIDAPSTDRQGGGR